LANILPAGTVEEPVFYNDRIKSGKNSFQKPYRFFREYRKNGNPPLRRAVRAHSREGLETDCAMAYILNAHNQTGRRIGKESFFNISQYPVLSEQNV